MDLYTNNGLSLTHDRYFSPYFFIGITTHHSHGGDTKCVSEKSQNEDETRSHSGQERL